MAQTLALGGISTQTVQKAAGEFSKPEGYGAVLGAGAAVALEKLLFSSMRGLFGYAIEKDGRTVYVAPEASGNPDPENPLEIAPIMRLLAKTGLALAGASVYIGPKDKMAKFAGLGTMAVAGFHVAEDLLALVGVELQFPRACRDEPTPRRSLVGGSLFIPCMRQWTAGTRRPAGHAGLPRAYRMEPHPSIVANPVRPDHEAGQAANPPQAPRKRPGPAAFPEPPRL